MTKGEAIQNLDALLRHAKDGAMAYCELAGMTEAEIDATVSDLARSMRRLADVAHRRSSQGGKP